MNPKHENPNLIRRFIGWLFGSPFRDLPPEFGDPVPADLRAFEVETEEASHHASGHAVAGAPVEDHLAPPGHTDEALKRKTEKSTH